MTDYEKQEIEKYPEIYYLGLDACKINAKPGTALNSGYDDDNGSYNKVGSQKNVLRRIITNLSFHISKGDPRPRLLPVRNP